MNIVLIGFRGSGKTTVAVLLAERLGMPRLDADEEIQRCAGMTIAQIFQRDGEPGFRECESRVIREIAELDGYVLSLGGGAILREENREAVRRNGWVVWLRIDAPTALARIQTDLATAQQRPALTEMSQEEEIASLLAYRDPIYEQCAALTVDTVGKTPQQIAERIAQAWRETRS